MSEKRFKSKLINKHDYEVNWLKAVNFIPDRGELVIYDSELDESGNPIEGVLPLGRSEAFGYARFKFGDGITKVTDLPFATFSPEEIRDLIETPDFQQVQADWLIGDPNHLGYIKNKPDLSHLDDFELKTSKVSVIDVTVNNDQYPSAKAVKDYVDQFIDTTDHSLVVDYKYPISWDGTSAGLTIVTVDNENIFCQVARYSLRHAIKITEQRESGSNSYGTVPGLLYNPESTEDYSLYKNAAGAELIISTYKNDVVYNNLVFPYKGTYFRATENAAGKIWISKVVQDITEYNRDDLPNAVIEVVNNKVTSISDKNTEEQYPTAKAVIEYTKEIKETIPNKDLVEMKTNKVTTIDENSNDDNYPSAKAVKDFIENSVVVPDLSGYEKEENKIQDLSQEVTDIQYPSAKAVKNFVENSVVVPDLDIYEKEENKVDDFSVIDSNTYPSTNAVKNYVNLLIPDTTNFERVSRRTNVINDSSTDYQYPTAKAVKTYIDENTITKLPDLSGYEEKSKKVNSINISFSDHELYPSAKAVKDYLDENIPDISGLENKESRVELINDSASHEEYPSAKAVKSYVDDKFGTVSTFQKNILVDCAADKSWDGVTTGLPSLVQVYYGTNFYRVFETPIIGKITNVVLQETAGDSYNIQIDKDAIYSPEKQTEFIYTYSCGQAESVIISVLKDSVSYGNLAFPYRGTYLMLKDYSASYGKLWIASLTVLESNYDHKDMPDIKIEVANNKTQVIDDNSTHEQYPTAKAVNESLKNIVEKTIPIEQDLFPLTELNNFEFDSYFNAFSQEVPINFNPRIGETYQVTWDNQTWSCVGLDGSAIQPGAVLLGNCAALDPTFPGNGEDFVIGLYDGLGTFISTTDFSTTAHRVRIYQNGSAAADWTQNDINGNGYIHNRPFYVGEPIETLFIPETEASFSYDSDQGASVFSNELTEEYVQVWESDWETAKVVWDGVAYTTTAKKIGGIKLIGNLDSYLGTGDSGEPFIGGVGLSASNILTVFCLTDPAPEDPANPPEILHEVSVTLMMNNIKKLDSKFIGEISWRNIIDKPFGTVSAGSVVADESTILVEDILPLTTINADNVMVDALYDVYVNDVAYSGIGVEQDSQPMILIGTQSGTEVGMLAPLYGGIVVLDETFITAGELTTVKITLKSDFIKKIDAQYLPENTDSKLPEVSESDEGKFLRVVNKTWTAVAIANAETTAF